VTRRFVFDNGELCIAAPASERRISMNRDLRRFLISALLVVTSSTLSAEVLTYEGTLTSAGLPATGSFDFRFRLYDGPDPGVSETIGREIRVDGVQVWHGRFSVDLEIDPDLTHRGSAWLEIEVARSDRLGGFALLEPRQRIIPGTTVQAKSTVASGAVVFFDLPSCPSGWSEYGLGHGRVIVGLPAGGLLNATVGTRLSDREVRDHTHSFPGLSLTNFAGEHRHLWSRIVTTGSGQIQWHSFDENGSWQLASWWNNGIGDEGAGTYPLAADPTQYFYTNFGDSEHRHSVGLPSTQESSGALPYVQLLACFKE
jgi:hypothetical protein